MDVLEGAQRPCPIKQIDHQPTGAPDRGSLSKWPLLHPTCPWLGCSDVYEAATGAALGVFKGF